ncbi:MAG TPA: TaqI family restriction endonuclease, partial [Flavisolibacter sp.]|nr:TaqI family restriction endonuclease [Flavisolibacter sp.]
MTTDSGSSSTQNLLAQYENFLEGLQLNPALFKTKTVEMDLKGELNPSAHLDRVFFSENKWMGFEEFYQYYFQRQKDVIK